MTTFTAGPAANFPGATSVNDTLEDVLLEFEDAGMAGSHPDTTGSFAGSPANAWTPGLAGSSYTYGNATLDYGFQVTGDLYYYFNSVVTPGGAGSGAPDHTLFGRIDEITLYTDSDNDGQFDDNPFLTIDFDSTPINGSLAAGNDVHNVVWNLMQGSTSGLEAELIERGIDLTDTVADLVAGSPWALAESELLLAA